MALRVSLYSSGFEDFTTVLARDLADVDGLTVSVIVPEDQRESFAVRLEGGDLAPRIDLHTVPFFRVRDPRGLRLREHLRQAVRDIGTDVLHHQLGGDPWSVLAIRRLSHELPVVTTIHEIRPRWRDEDQWWTVLTRRMAVGHSSILIALTEKTKLAIEERYPTRTKETAMVPSGEAGSWYRRRSGTGSLPDWPGPATALFFGRIRPYKGLDLLLAASERVAADCHDFRLIIAGSGAGKDRLFPNGVPDWADLRLGHVADQDVAGLFDGARIVVLPYREASQSGVTANAFGLGCPVLVSDVGGLTDGVAEGENGLIVPANDLDALTEALRRVMVDDHLAALLRQGAFERRSSWAQERRRIAEATAQIYARAAHT